MRRRILIALGLLVFLLISGLCAAVYTLAYTERGLHFVVDHIPRKIGRTEMVFVGASGTIAGGFSVKRFELEHERVTVRAEGIDVRVRLLPLLLQTVYARDVTVKNAFVQIHRRKTPPPTSAPRFLPRGLIIQGDRVHVDAGTLIVQNGRQFDLTNVNSSGLLRHRTMRFYEGSNFEWGDIHVSGNTTLHAADPMEIEGDARILMRFENQPLWVIATSGEGNLDKLNLTAEFTAPFQASFAGAAEDLTTGWHWHGKGRVKTLDLRAWNAGGALGRIHGQLEVKGDSEGFEGRGPLTSDGLGVGPFQTLFEGSYADRVVTAKRIELTHIASNAHVDGTGSIGIVPGGPKLDLHGRWNKFRWPLVGENIALQSEQGEYAISGIRPFDVRTIGPLQPTGFDPMQVEMEGKLGAEKLNVSSADVALFDGHALVSGEVAWSPSESWKVMGDATDINPGRVREDLPGRLDFKFAAEGKGFAKDDDFSVEIRNLAGRLRGAPATGGGRIAKAGTAWELDRVNLALGRTNLSADGRIDEALDLRFAVDAEDLSLLKQGSRGKLRGEGSLRGTWTDPIVKAELRASGIEHEGITLESIDADVDFDSTGERASKIDLHARNLVYSERTLSDLEFRLNGSALDHAIRMDAKVQGGLVMNSEMAGAFSHGEWRGHLNKLNVSGSENLQLALASPVEAEVSAQHTRVGLFCLQGAPAKLCAEGDWRPAEWNAMLNASDLPMRTLTSGLTPSVDYRGRLNVMARAYGGSSVPVQGNIRADLVDAAIQHKLASGRTEQIRFGTGLVLVNATDSMIDASVELDAEKVGSIKGKLEAARVTRRWQDMPIDGELHVQTEELGLITLYVPDADRVAGRLVTDLSIGGTLGTPLLDGMLKLSDAELDLYQVNMSMRAAQLEARLHQNGLDFAGSARVGAGNLSTKGHLEWRDGNPYGQLDLDGENLRVVDVPEAQIDASPALDFKIQGRRIEVTGAVKVPYAKIVPADLTNAVRSSSDEVLVGTEPVDPEKRFEVATGISLTLGDKVSIDTLGLTARLEGTLTLRSGTDEITSGSGELNVHDGKYTAYGRRLDIERGRLLFSGGPVNNPGVDIRAIKQYPDVKAGINVRGTLLQPRLSFFSEPSLPQSQIVSLILAGGSIESAQNRGNQNGTGNELLAQGSAILAQQLGQRVGLEDVSLESDLDNQTSLVLGKYLSPRLYISYGISFTEQINTLKLRYTLTDRWTIKTEIGEAKGADLVFTIGK